MVDSVRKMPRFGARDTQSGEPANYGAGCLMRPIELACVHALALAVRTSVPAAAKVGAGKTVTDIRFALAEAE